MRPFKGMGGVLLFSLSDSQYFHPTLTQIDSYTILMNEYTVFLNNSGTSTESKLICYFNTSNSNTTTMFI